MSRRLLQKVVLVGAECEENLSLRYIRASLERVGHPVVQVDFNRREEIEQAARAIASCGAPLAGFSMVFLRRAREFAALARRVRQRGYDGHIVAGGHFAAFNADALLRDEPAFDSVAIGEGENLMPDLAAHLGELGAVRGLVWRTPEGAVVRNPPAEKPADLDAIPMPVRKWPPDRFLGIPVAGIIGSRGCTHSCAFCSVSAWHKLCGGARLRLRSPAGIADEMADLYGRGYRVFKFNDDNFVLRDRREALARVRALKRELEARPVGRIAIAVKSRPDSVDLELFSLLKEMGLFRVFVGIEAGTPESLANLGRTQTVEQNVAALDTLNALDLHVCFNIILFNPDSTVEDFLANVQFLRRYPTNPSNFCRAEIYPGTRLEENLRRAGRLEGTYWAHNYTISDPRAEEAYRLMDECFHSRHHGQAGPHVLALKVDFERRLMSHFRPCPGSMAVMSAGFLRRLNENTCDYLEEMGRRAARGFGSAVERADYVAALLRRVGNDNAMFVREAEILLEEMHGFSEASTRGQPGALTRAAAAIGVAASISLAGRGAEAAGAGGAGANAAAAGGTNAVSAAQMTAPQLFLRETVRSDLLPGIGRTLDGADAVTVTVKIGKDYSVTNCCFTVAGRGRTNAMDAATASLLGQKLPQCEPGEHEIRFTREEVAPHLKPALGEGESDPLVVQKAVVVEALPFLTARIRPLQDIRIELWVGAAGKVAQAWVLAGKATNVVAALSDAEKKVAAELIKGLGADKAADRDSATRELARMGSGIVGLLKAQLATTSDPEVEERCYSLVRDLSGGLPFGSESEVIVFLRSMRLKTDDAFGKRFVVPISKWQLERAGRIYDRQEDTHDMAPGPAN